MVPGRVPCGDRMENWRIEQKARPLKSLTDDRVTESYVIGLNRRRLREEKNSGYEKAATIGNTIVVVNPSANKIPFFKHERGDEEKKDRCERSHQIADKAVSECPR